MNDGIKEELERKRQSSVDNSENVESVKLLMSGADDDKKALRRVGLDHEVKKAENKKGIEIERKNLEETYKDLVFTRQEIKDICIKYDLRFLKTEHFKAALDTEVATKLKHFVADNPEIGESSDSFYIIAPENAFELERTSAKPFLTTDLILVYKIPTGGDDKFVYIHKWGKDDYTLFRRLKGIFYESTGSIVSITMSAWIITISTIFGMLFSGFTGEWYQYLNMIWIVAVSFGLAMATLAILFNDGEMELYKRVSSYVWNNYKNRRRIS